MVAFQLDSVISLALQLFVSKYLSALVTQVQSTDSIVGGHSYSLASLAERVDNVDIVELEIGGVHTQCGSQVVAGLCLLTLTSSDCDLVTGVRFV